MNKIGYFQLAVLLVLSRIFSEAMNFPLESASYGMQRFTVILTAKLILVILYIPILIFISRHPGENMIEYVCRRNKTFGWVAGILLTLSIFATCVLTVCKLEYYTTSTIINEAPAAFLVISLLLTCAYGFYKGIQSISRVATLVAVAFVAFLTLITFSSAKMMNFNFLYPALIDNPDIFLQEVLIELSKNAEILIFPILCGFVRQSSRNSLIGYIIAITVVIEALTLLETVILGPYMTRLNFPLYMISSLTDLIVFQRLDGIDVVVWIMACVVKLTIFTICLQTIFKTLLHSEISGKIAAAINLLLTGVAAIYLTGEKAVLLMLKTWYNTALPMLVGFIIPLIVVIFMKGENNGKNKKKRSQSVVESGENIVSDVANS